MTQANSLIPAVTKVPANGERFDGFTVLTAGTVSMTDEVGNVSALSWPAGQFSCRGTINTAGTAAVLLIHRIVPS